MTKRGRKTGKGRRPATRGPTSYRAADHTLAARIERFCIPILRRIPKNMRICLLFLLAVGIFMVDLFVLSWPVHLARDYMGADLNNTYDTVVVQVQSCGHRPRSMGLMFTCRLKEPVFEPEFDATTQFMRAHTDLAGATVSARVYAETTGRRFRRSYLIIVPESYPDPPDSVRRLFDALGIITMIGALLLPLGILYVLSKIAELVDKLGRRRKSGRSTRRARVLKSARSGRSNEQGVRRS